MSGVLFHGFAICAIDARGCFVPPAFVGDAAGEAELLVARHDTAPCLIAYPPAHLHVLAERSERRRLADAAHGLDEQEHHHRMRGTFGLVARMEH